MTGMVIIVIGALVMAAVGLPLRQRKMVRTRQLQGLEWITGLAELISLIQQHRGLSNGVKHGGQGLESQLRDTETAISRQWQQLQAKRFGLHTPSSQAVCQHCQTLLGQWPQLSADTNLERHNRVIASLIQLLEDVAIRRHLSGYHLPRFSAVDILWRELLLTVENIGQLRALGTGIAAAGQCNSVQRIRLSFLAQKCSQLSSDLTISIGRFRQQGAELDRLARLVEQAHEAFMALQRLAQRELLDSARVTLSSEHFFRQASAAMEQYGAVFQCGLASVRGDVGGAS